MAEAGPDALLRRWTHSHEEDHAGLMVLRPSTWPFPPSRGRRSYEFDAGGKLTLGGPGPTDRYAENMGRWRTLPNGQIELVPAGRPALRMTIFEVEDDKLVVRIEAQP